ncbi:hypothetical protein HYDPIDRAFT_114604 [Hydnomerulius pinastri MD-312]|uniref:Unplaced genomic scaffold scaffold_21, whole genome shotgun sequence n=1 Tax=Hydnomerulius pinastri MD-312 TaxID=994086 RepID=A0A0C9W6E2_9AGAM|nr:hypothetical protein HYDPIDRAFT_114604 [Hydnomerulius pinastri MD-312]
MIDSSSSHKVPASRNGLPRFWRKLVSSNMHVCRVNAPPTLRRSTSFLCRWLWSGQSSAKAKKPTVSLSSDSEVSALSLPRGFQLKRSTILVEIFASLTQRQSVCDSSQVPKLPPFLLALFQSVLRIGSRNLSASCDLGPRAVCPGWKPGGE